MTYSIFDSKSVCVIGASANRKKVGHAVLSNLKATYNGKLYAVNPSHNKILGIRCYPDVQSVKKKIDLAVIAIPANFVPQVLEECGRSNVKHVLIISAGFKETGKNGSKLERQCLDVIRRYNMRMVGPNCLGIIDTSTGLNATFAKQQALKGNIAFMSQSGALCTAILDWAQENQIGFSKFISLGNKADLSENEFLKILGDDKNTNVILAYLEGLVDGERFIKIAQKVSKKKPIIILKSGRTAAGARAVASHTGTLAGTDNAYDAAFDKAGIIRVDYTKELFDYARSFSTQPVPKGSNVAVLTNAGGPGIIATDACERAGLKLAKFTKSTINKLSKALPAAANIYNPVDVLGDALADRYEKALEAIVNDKEVDSVIVLLTPQLMTDAEKVAKIVSRVEKTTNKPILCSFFGGASVEPGIRILQDNRIPNYMFPENAVNSMKSMVSYRRHLNKRPSKVPKFKFDKGKIKRIIEDHIKSGRVNIGLESLDMLEACGIPICKSVVVKNVDNALKFQRKLGKPVALKVVSDNILHKTDIGCVELGVNRSNLKSAYNRIIFNALKYMPHALIAGVLVQEMIMDGKEIIVGVSLDPQVGHIMMFGLGGIYVEILKDVSFGVVPITEAESADMINNIQGDKILKGVRGERQSDLASIEDVLLRVSQLASQFPEIVELDINPLRVFETGAGCVALDARIVLKK